MLWDLRACHCVCNNILSWYDPIKTLETVRESQSESKFFFVSFDESNAYNDGRENHHRACYDHINNIDINNYHSALGDV